MYRFLLLILISSLLSCKKNSREHSDWFLIEIKALKNMDCGVPEIVFLSRQAEAYKILGNSGGIYIAIGLPKVNYPVGTKMNVLIHKPLPGETLICTTQGPSWAQVFIERIK